jgi:TolB-like protein/Tfp pilus assembly protein PilF
MNFFAELKRRNVYKVAVAYAVVSWLLIQAASILFPAFDAPASAIKILVIILVLGFPIALIFSWAFEITPEGIKLESEVAANQSITRKTGRKIVAITTVLAVIAAGLFVFQFIRARSTSSSAAASEVPNKSIAVLPFDNLSRDPDNAYFAEGVQDEILTRLAKVADLKVISRTSTQHFKSAPENLPQIAKQLGVMNILEGSIQKSGNQVRVNVQLINALTDAHLWADTFDRQLTDIFAVETEIAKNIAEALQAKLTGSEQKSIAKAPTTNPEAYELYLKGRFFWNKRSGADLRKAIDYFNQAIAKDPNYALAYAGLADSYMLLPNYGGASTQEAVVPARAAVTKALQLDDSLAEAHASMGLLDTLELHLRRAVGDFERAIQLKPNYATAHHWLMLGQLSLGRFDQAVAEGKRSLELDPLSLIINADFAWTYSCAHRFDEAETQARKTLEIDPRFFLAHYYLGGILQLKGRVNEAVPEFQKSVELNNDAYSLAALGQAYARNGQKEEAKKIFDQLTAEEKSRYIAPYAWALLFIGLSDKERALGQLEQAYQRGDTNYLFVLKVDPLFDDLRSDPRFEALVQKIVGPKKEAKP